MRVSPFVTHASAYSIPRSRAVPEPQSSAGARRRYLLWDTGQHLHADQWGPGLGCFPCPPVTGGKNQGPESEVTFPGAQGQQGEGQAKTQTPAFSLHTTLPPPPPQSGPPRGYSVVSLQASHCLTPPVPGHHLPDSPASASRFGLDGQSALIRVESSQGRVLEGTCPPVGPSASAGMRTTGSE